MHTARRVEPAGSGRSGAFASVRLRLAMALGDSARSLGRVRRAAGRGTLAACLTLLAFSALPGAAARATTDTLRWGAPHSIETAHGDPVAVSCASTSFCVSVDNQNASYVYNGTTWTGPIAVNDFPHRVTALSCAPTGHCIAVDDSGRAASFDGSAWTTPATVDGVALAGISCPSSTFCLAADVAGHALTYNGSVWSTPTAVSASAFASVSCVSSSFCVVGDGSGHAWRYDGSSWTSTALGTGPSVSWVSCSSATFCTAMADDSSTGRGIAYLYDGTGWSAGTPVTQNDVAGLSCISSTFCAVVDDWGQESTFDGSTWSASVAIDTVTIGRSLSCVSSSFCVYVDADGKSVALGATGWGTPASFDPLDAFESVSCPSSSWCLAVDAAGQAFRYDGTTWSPTPPADTGNLLFAVSCPTTNLCVAVGHNGYATLFNGSSWSAKQIDPPGANAHDLTAVSCPTGTFCVAVDNAGQAFTFNGSGWSGIGVGVGTPLESVSCPTTTFCMAGDNTGNVVSYDGQLWGSTRVADPNRPIVGLACPTTSFCVATDFDGGATQWDGSSWSPVSRIDPTNDGGPTALACASPTMCLAAVANGSVTRFDGNGWGTLQPVDGDGNLYALSCPSAQFCAGLDLAGQALVGTADTTPPSVTLEKAPSAVTASRSASVAFSAADPEDPVGSLSVTCQLDGAAPVACTSPYGVSGLADGTHTVTVQATDPAGNTSTPEPVSWRVDTTRPTLSLRAFKPFTLAGSVTPSWVGTDAGSGIASYDLRYERSWFGAGFAGWLYPTGWQHSTATHQTLGGLTPGYDYCFSVRARDEAGNTSAWTAARCTARPLDDRALLAGTGWLRGTARGFYLNTYTATTATGRTLMRTGALLDRIALVATTCSNCGTVAVYVNGRLLKAVSLASSTTQRGVVITLPTFGYREASIVLRTVTSHKIVQIDGLGLSRS